MTNEFDAIRDALERGITVTTSGTTARPKRVALSAAALHASISATADAIGTGGWVLALPLSYIAGIMVVLRAQAAGTELVDARQEPFDADTFIQVVSSLGDGSWFTSVVPTQLARLVDAAENVLEARDALRRFDRILVGGQAVPAGLIDRAVACGIRVTKTYGSAETAGGVVYDGVPIGDTAVRIDSDGRVLIATSSLADGYDGDPQMTAENFVDTDGRRWWRTSDIGSLSDGALTIDGRTDDIIITGGLKVSLADIERVLEQEAIEAVATWFDDAEWGQVPALVSTTELDQAAVRGLIETSLSKAARPYRFVTVPEIPRLSSGKVDRLAVRRIIEGARS